MTMRALHLYGELADRFGPHHDVAVATIPEALRIIECNHPGFIRAIRRQRFHVAHGSAAPAEAAELPIHHLFVPTSSGDWHLVPALGGAKSGGFKTVFSIIIGGALLATGIGGAIGAGAFAAGGASTTAAFAAGSGFLGLSFGTISLIGASFFLGGINQLLTQTPATDTGSKKPTSFSFDGPTETEDEGGPLQIIVGEVICSGIRAASAVESTNSASISQYAGADGSGLDGIFGQGRYAFLVNQ